jgi:hypothetical protein
VDDALAVDVLEGDGDLGGEEACARKREGTLWVRDRYLPLHMAPGLAKRAHGSAKVPFGFRVES